MVAVVDSDWLTWPQAAELAGCPVPTVEHYARTGRIERRPGPGRPSLRRESVEEFVIWWQQESSRRAQRLADKEQRRIRPPEPEGWILAKDAAELLGHAHSDHIVWLARQGRFEARKVGVRWWVREAEIREYKDGRDQWVSHIKAAEIVGCSRDTIRRAVNSGKIEKRDVHRTRASLSRASVFAFSETFAKPAATKK